MTLELSETCLLDDFNGIVLTFRFVAHQFADSFTPTHLPDDFVPPTRPPDDLALSTNSSAGWFRRTNLFTRWLWNSQKLVHQVTLMVLYLLFDSLLINLLTHSPQLVCQMTSSLQLICQTTWPSLPTWLPDDLDAPTHSPDNFGTLGTHPPDNFEGIVNAFQFGAGVLADYITHWLICWTISQVSGLDLCFIVSLLAGTDTLKLSAWCAWALVCEMTIEVLCLVCVISCVSLLASLCQVYWPCPRWIFCHTLTLWLVPWTT